MDFGGKFLFCFVKSSRNTKGEVKHLCSIMCSFSPRGVGAGSEGGEGKEGIDHSKISMGGWKFSYG